jgi:hypothetical protein
MPNMCSFSLVAEGKPKDLREFAKYFIYEGEQGTKEGPYLARTFIDECKTCEEFVKAKKEEFDAGSVRFDGWCAWSCYSCWISGYPNEENGCVFLSDICKKHKVTISSDSEEDGIGFTEKIICEDNGYITDTCEDYPVYICSKCHEKTSINPNYDPREESCWECDTVGEWIGVEKND